MSATDQRDEQVGLATRLLKDISPGRWSAYCPRGVNWYVLDERGNYVLETVVGNGHAAFRAGHDAEFIAAAPQLVRDLLTQLSTLQAEHVRLREENARVEQDRDIFKAELHYLQGMYRSAQAEIFRQREALEQIAGELEQWAAKHAKRVEWHQVSVESKELDELLTRFRSLTGSQKDAANG